MERFDISHFLDRIHKTFHINVTNDWTLFNKPVHFCVYEYKRNPRKGQTCAVKIKEGEYCSKHKKEAKAVKEEAKKIKVAKDINEVKDVVKNVKESKEIIKEVKEEAKKIKVDKDIKDVKEVAKDVKESKEIVKDVKEVKEVKNLFVLLNKKINRYVHEETRLVFFSKDNKIVYGKLSVLEDKVVHLNDKDIDLCKRYQFRYDETLIETTTPSY